MPPDTTVSQVAATRRGEVIDQILGQLGDIETEAGPVGTDINPPLAPPDVPEAPEADPQTPPEPLSAPDQPPSAPDEEPPETDFIPPGGPIWEPAPDDQPPGDSAPTVKLSDGTELPLSEVERLIRQAPPPPSPTFPQPTPQLPAPPGGDAQPPLLAPSIPPFTDEDLENPALRAVLQVAIGQQQRLAELETAQRTLAENQHQATYVENAQIANSAVTQFKASHNLPDQLMDKIIAHASELVPLEANRLATAGNYNPYLAVTNALEAGYWLVPEARRFEFDRQYDQRSKSLERQRKLNGVGGSSGSAPRTPAPPDTSTPQGFYDQMVAEVAAAMNEGNE